MTIEELVKEQIEQLDINSLVRGEIRTMISADVKREIAVTTKEEVAKIIRTEVDIVMSKGVNTDDGWGKKEQFESFEEMFKKIFSEQLNSKYEVQKVVKDFVTTEVKRLVEAKAKDIAVALNNQLNGTSNA